MVAIWPAHRARAAPHDLLQVVARREGLLEAGGDVDQSAAVDGTNESENMSTVTDPMTRYS